MRISTQSFYQGNTSRLMDLQSKMDRLTQNIASGRANLRPSDDPLAATQLLAIREAESRNSQFASNRLQAQNTLGIVDSSLSQLTNTLGSAKETLVSAGNGALSGDQLRILGTTLSGLVDEAAGILNTTDGTGRHLFAGLRDDVEPLSLPGLSYVGDTDARMLQVAERRRLDVSEPASRMLPESGGQNALQALAAAAAILQDPAANRADQVTAANTANDLLDQMVTSVADRQAAVGVRLQELERLDTQGDDRELQLVESLAELEEVDYTEALSTLSRQQLALTAAQKSFQMVSGLSLFNYL